MMHRLLPFYSLLCVICFSVTATAQINTGSPTIPFGSKINADATPYDFGIVPGNLPGGSYNPGSGQYGKSQDAADAYTSWKTNYTSACGSNTRVKFDDPNKTVSEGIGYGMLLAAYAGDKPLFDGLWGYYKANSNGNKVMNWRTGVCSPDQSGGATDADLDAAMALLVAKCQWPTATSPYNYDTEATMLITAIKNTEIHNTSFQAINGDGWGFGSTCRNPGYQSPAYYRQFGEYLTSQSGTWTNAVNAAYTLLNANRNTTTGLVSNWSDPNGSPGSCNGSNEYGYDACRNPWRMAADVLWYGTATAQTNFCTPIAVYVNGKGANGAGGPVAQAGGSGTVNATFTSTFAAGICGSTTTYQSIMNSMYTKTVGTIDGSGYFGNTLRVISLFVQTGNFWKPCSAATTPASITVALTSPTNGQSFNEGDVITLSATATATTGSITNVEFYNGTTLIGSDNNSPYSISWSTAAAGSANITAKAYTSTENASTVAVTITIIKAVLQTSTSPTIDGTIDAVWGGSNTQANLATVIDGAISSATDLSANYKAMWDNTYFYLLVDVTDDVKTNNAGTDFYNDDAIEVFFDIGNNKASTYGSNDFQYTFRWNDATVHEAGGKTTGVTFGKVDKGNGYTMEMRFPWSTLTGTPSANQLVGFDVEINDDDDGGNRDGKLSWAATADQAWQNPSYFGTVILKTVACTNPSAAGSISGSSAVCSGQTGVTYSINTVSGATGYTWTLPSGASITSGSGTSSITVTFGSSAGTVMVVPTNSCGSGASSQLSVSVNPSVTPSVTISPMATTICIGTTVNFSATPSNGGTPTYQWRKNGTILPGATNSTYSATGISNNDKFDVVMTSTVACASAPTATSAQGTVTVNNSVTPSVSITPSSTTICSGATVNFSAIPVNGGSPTYQWRKNGVNISGATNSAYAATGISNNDKFDVVMTSTAACASTATATSAQSTVTVNNSVTPSVSITPSSTTICSGATVNFSAIPVNGGSPTYQWRKNGVNISGATNSAYAATGISNNDTFDVVMTSTATCASVPTATSAQSTITVTSSVTASVTISVNPSNTIYQGTLVTFNATVTNGGTSPTYQWKKNGVAISGEVGSSYASTALVNGDKITVQITSNAGCVSNPTVTSSATTMTVKANPAFSTSITGSSNVSPNQNNVSYSVANNSANGVTYVWTVPAGATIISGQGTNAIVVKFGTSSGTLSVTETNGAGQSHTTSLTVSVGTTTPVTLSEGAMQINLYPVPCSDRVTIDLTSLEQTVIDYSIIDMTGNTVASASLDYQGMPADIQTSSLPQGTYMVFISWNGNTAMKKIQKVY